MSTLSYILEHKIVAIMRGMPAKDAVGLANALLRGGINILEITLNSPNALQVIEELSQQFNGTMLIGAGTVLTAEEANDAINAGAQFIDRFDMQICSMLQNVPVYVGKSERLSSISV